MALSHAKLEKEEGDLLSRRRKVDAMLNRDDATDPTRAGDPPWYFGPLEVAPHPKDGFLKVHDPDGGLHEVDYRGMDDPDRIESVEAELRGVWEDWLDAL